MGYTLDFSQINMKMVSEVGGKNASLGEMFNRLNRDGVLVPDGFAVNVNAYRRFLEFNLLQESLAHVLNNLDLSTFVNLDEVGKQARALIHKCVWPEDVKRGILTAYASLLKRQPAGITVAVRSSATAEDLPGASFAGQMETFLNVSGDVPLLEACHRCFASLFTNRAIKYRVDNGFDHMQVGVSVGVQRMVRSDLTSSGVGFTLEPETGNPNVIILTGAFGLGENVVQGTVTPDQFTVFKGGSTGKPALIARELGAKEKTMIYAPAGSEAGVTTLNLETDPLKSRTFTLSEEEVLKLAGWCLRIEEHYRQPMDIEWAKDGITGEMFIVQARPETVHSAGNKNPTYEIKQRGKILAQGIAVGTAIATGVARRLNSPSESHLLKQGEVLITSMTNPDWDPIMKKAAAIVTDKGGRTSHAAIVARELGLVALVGTGNATESISDGQEVTVSCAEGETGYVYEGKVPFTVSETNLNNLRRPHTKAMIILGDPDRAFQAAELPCEGIGLMRLEFVINNAIRIHPVALARWDTFHEGPAKEEIRKLTEGYSDKASYFVDKLASAVAVTAAAFHPREVIVRMSDFKSNEYAALLGGSQFEPHEENPMLGFRGASRYYHPLYRDGFRLECLAMRKVRNEMGLTNVKLMIPFCRTVEEAAKVETEMAANGLRRGKNGLELYVMVEIPSNVLLMTEFAKHFDGFSIGSNDLTQLTLGLDRDSALVSPLFSESNPAVKELIARAIHTAKRCGRKIGLCGQAPSDDPEFAKFLVQEGIDSISFNPDALFKGMINMVAAEDNRA